MGIHQKHAPLVKPDLGKFGRNEMAILGTPCGNIKNLASGIINALKDDMSIAYVDADHKSVDDPGGDKLTGAMNSGATVDFVDKINYLQINKLSDDNPFQLKKSFSDQDIIIVNGNHFTADKQILVIDPKKDLQNKLDRITDVAMIILKEPENTIPDFLRDHINDFNNIPIYNFYDLESITSQVRGFVTGRSPRIKGLVLAGGNSQRMNTDKGLIHYHGVPQREYAAELLSNYCDEVFISCRLDQVQDIDGKYRPLVDTFEGLGPFGGIVSAFREDPNSAWFAVACDLPYLDKVTLHSLISSRNTSKIATSFWDTDHKFPEPLITIWEPRAYSEMLYFLSMGHSCPRKVLINSNTEVIDAPDNHALTNINYPEEMKAVLESVKNAK